MLPRDSKDRHSREQPRKLSAHCRRCAFLTEEMLRAPRWGLWRQIAHSNMAALARSSAEGPSGSPARADGLSVVFMEYLRLPMMMRNDTFNGEIPWHSLLNRAEARVLSPGEERRLLVELAECRTRIVASLPESSAAREPRAAELEFQQRVRELTSSESGRDPLSDEVREVAER